MTGYGSHALLHFLGALQLAASYLVQLVIVGVPLFILGEWCPLLFTEMQQLPRTVRVLIESGKEQCNVILADNTNQVKKCVILKISTVETHFHTSVEFENDLTCTRLKFDSQFAGHYFWTNSFGAPLYRDATIATHSCSWDLN